MSRLLDQLKRLERRYQDSRDPSLLSEINAIRIRLGMAEVDENLREIRITGTNFWEDPDAQLIHRGDFEPHEQRPAWGLTREQFAQLVCNECHRPFQADGAGGVMGGLFIVNADAGNEYYHGYADQPSSCAMRALRRMTGGQRRNPDESFRKLKLAAEHGDPEAQSSYSITLRRTGQVPVGLEPYLDYILPDHWYGYITVIQVLEKLGIPYSFGPSPRCNCENMACLDNHPMRLCYMCDGPISVVGSRWTCENPDCEMSSEYAGGQPETHTLTPGICNKFAWRTHVDYVGSLCDECGKRIPPEEHTNLCNCPACSAGVGPLLTIRTRLISTERLNLLLRATSSITQVNRRLIYPYSGAEDRSWPPGLGNQSRIDRFSECVIEIRPDNSIRLRMMEHLPERKIPPNLNVQTMKNLVSPGDNPERFSELMSLHLFGKDFASAKELEQHLMAPGNAPPNMVQVVSQIMTYGDSLFEFLPLHQPIDPRAMHVDLFATDDVGASITIRIDREGTREAVTIQRGAEGFDRTFTMNRPSTQQLSTEIIAADMGYYL